MYRCHVGRRVHGAAPTSEHHLTGHTAVPYEVSIPLVRADRLHLDVRRLLDAMNTTVDVHRIKVKKTKPLRFTLQSSKGPLGTVCEQGELGETD